MAEYRISGIWEDEGVISHFAFHQLLENGKVSRAHKETKAGAIKIVETGGTIVKTWVWNYSKACWDVGETVVVVERQGEKYLRTLPDNTKRDNLDHLINYDWIARP